MKAYFSTCDLEDNEDDVKEVWNVGEACVARLGNEWYRAQVLEVNGSETAVVFVDLGNVRRIACRDLRIPREVIAMTWGVARKGYSTKYPSVGMRKCRILSPFPKRKRLFCVRLRETRPCDSRPGLEKEDTEKPLKLR